MPGYFHFAKSLCQIPNQQKNKPREIVIFFVCYSIAGAKHTCAQFSCEHWYAIHIGADQCEYD